MLAVRVALPKQTAVTALQALAVVAAVAAE
jgi:hypothetical protein